MCGEDPRQVFHQRFFEIVKIISKDTCIPETKIQNTLNHYFHVQIMKGEIEHLFKKNGADIIKSRTYKRIHATINKYDMKLCIFDTKSRFSGLPENDNALGSKEVDLYDHLSSGNNCTIIIIHHTGKSTPSNGDLSNAFRGASSFVSNLRFGLHISRNLSEKIKADKGLSPEDEVDFLTISNPKQNCCRNHPPFIVERTEGFRFRAIDLDMSNIKSEKKEQEIEMICDYLSENPGITQAQIIQEFSGTISNHAVREAVKDMIEKGVVKKNGKGKRDSRLYLVENEKNAEDVRKAA